MGRTPSAAASTFILIQPIRITVITAMNRGRLSRAVT